MYLLEMMDCEYASAIYTGDREKDNKANTEMYVNLVQEGKNNGFCPVLIDKSIMHYVNASQYGFTDSKEDYYKITNRIVDLVEENCFSVWLGRIIYNYYLDCTEYEEDVADSLEMLEPPSDKDYEAIFSHPIEEKKFIFGRNPGYLPYDFSFENHVFVKVPVTEPWKVLAWIPTGGFNWCPDEVHQTALAKGLYEKFGARIMYVSSCALEYYLPVALSSKEVFEEAAKILIAADNDIYVDYDVAAGRILGSHNWFMWWD